jgi:HEAT repeat protein
VLLDLLADVDADLRQAAAEALGRLGHALARDRLAEATHDPARRVREAAAEALGRLP